MQPVVLSPVVSLLLAIIGTLIMLGVGLLIHWSRQQSTTAAAHSETLTRLETVLTGADGTNGLNGEVKALRAARHEQANTLHALQGQVSMHEYRIAALEGK